MSLNLSLEEALLVTGVLSGALLLLFFYLMFLKMAVNRRERRKQEWLERLSEGDSAFERYLGAGGYSSRTLVPREQLALEVFEEYLLHRLKLSQTAGEVERIRSYAAKYLAGYCRSRLSSRRKSERLNAMLSAESLRLTVLIPELEGVLKGRKYDAEERHMACRVLARFQHEPVVRLLSEDYFPMPPFVIRQMLQVLDPSWLERLMREPERLPADVRSNLVDVVRIRNIRTAEMLALLEALLDSEHQELRIRTLKALANFGYMSDEAIEAFLLRINGVPPEQWQERLMAVRLMGSLKDERFLDTLERLMGDPVYLVRTEAAKSVALFRGGRQRLERIAYAHPDRYAREIAAERLVSEG